MCIHTPGNFLLLSSNKSTDKRRIEHSFMIMIQNVFFVMVWNELHPIFYVQNSIVHMNTPALIVFAEHLTSQI